MSVVSVAESMDRSIEHSDRSAAPLIGVGVSSYKPLLLSPSLRLFPLSAVYLDLNEAEHRLRLVSALTRLHFLPPNALVQPTLLCV